MANKDLRRAEALLAAGDAANARYWYRKAGRGFSDDVAAEIGALRASREA